MTNLFSFNSTTSFVPPSPTMFPLFSIIQNDFSENVGSFEYHTNDVYKANELRRKIIKDVETWAINEISINENTTDVPDEIICLRLGLMIIKTTIDLMKTLNNTKFYHLNVENDNRYITTNDIEDLQFVDDFNIVRIYPNQKLSLSFNLKKSNGTEHTKWCPVSNIIYKPINNKYLFNLELVGNLSLDLILQQLL